MKYNGKYDLFLSETNEHHEKLGFVFYNKQCWLVGLHVIPVIQDEHKRTYNLK
jgi:hypothetical protein